MSVERILYINGGIMNRGGIESFMMNYYRHFDHNKLQVDFVVHGEEKGYYEEEIKLLGGKIYNVPVKSQNYKGNVKSLSEIFSNNNYRIIHSHMDAMSYIPLKIAKKHNIPYRIAHSHNTNHLTNNFVKRTVNNYARIALRKKANQLFACSDLAGKWLFGEKNFKKNGIVVNNAIDVEKFLFNEDIRNEVRKELNIEDKFVIGHVGRFDHQKNHSFLLDIFHKIHKKNKNAVLTLVGEGHLEEEIRKKAKDLDLTEFVIFLGSRADVNKILNAFDVFVFPSLFEGLGISLIEAQANGLPCIASDVIPEEVAITNLIKFISLNNSNEWINTILDAKRSEKNIYHEITEKGYNIEVEAKKLEYFYLDLLK